MFGNMMQNVNTCSKEADFTEDVGVWLFCSLTAYGNILKHRLIYIFTNGHTDLSSS